MEHFDVQEAFVKTKNTVCKKQTLQSDLESVEKF